MGDSSDNIPGVPGVGIKTATKLLKQYETVDRLYQNLDEITAKKLKENLTTYKEDALMSRELATINLESPITVAIDELTYDGYDVNDVYELFQDLEFRSLLKRIQGDEPLESETISDTFEYEIIDEIPNDFFTGREAIHVEMVKENYHEAPIECISIVNEHGNFAIETEKA